MRSSKVSTKQDRVAKKHVRCRSADAAIADTCNKRFEVVMGEIEKQGTRLEAVEASLIAVGAKVGVPF